MRLGALVSPFDGADANAIANQARILESLDYGSLWTAHAMGRGGMLTDPFIALSVASAVTSKITLGTAILQLPLYNPTDIALKSYSLAQVSNGRFVLGVGAGSTENDYAVHEAPFTERFAGFEKSLAALREIFATGEAGGLSLGPWPSVAGGPPLYFGTWGKNVARAAGEFDGWIASGMKRTPEQCADALKRYRSEGGGPAVVSTIQVMKDTDLGELGDRLTAFGEAGFDDAVVMLLPGAPDPEKIRALVD